jgi:hypothetical protein
MDNPAPSFQEKPQQAISCDEGAGGDRNQGQSLVTRREKAIGWCVLAFSWIGWTLPIAAHWFYGLWPVSAVVCATILGTVMALQSLWGGSAAGKIGIWIIAIWGSALLLMSIVGAMQEQFFKSLR